VGEQELKDILEAHKKHLKRFSPKWKLAKSLGSRYWISTSGKVASLLYPCGTLRPRPLILKRRISTNGYPIFAFERKNKTIHRIVAQEFIGSISGKVVHHIDGNRMNNHVSNLEITDYSKNNKCGRKTQDRNKAKLVKLVSSLEYPEAFV